MKKTLLENKIFKNILLIVFPTIISAIGVILPMAPTESTKTGLIMVSFFILVLLIGYILYISKIESQKEDQIKNLENEKDNLSIISSHLRLENKSYIYSINTLSVFMERWAKSINDYANEVKNTGIANEKYWDKYTLFQMVCERCRDAIKEYVGDKITSADVSVGFIEVYDINGEEKIKFVAHSNPESTRPDSYDKEELISKSRYHYAELIRERKSDIEVAVDNEEIRKIFKAVNPGSDLAKYNQYIAIPVFCSKRKMLGIFQIVIKNGFYIINDKQALQKYAELNLIVFANQILLIDKIHKGLYTTSSKKGV